MAIVKTTITARKGPYAEMDESKMQVGEIAIATDKPVLWFCWAEGKVAKVALEGSTGGGDLSQEQIEEAIAAYLQEHPLVENDPTVERKVGTHNSSTDAHEDIRLLIQGLTTRLNALADSDDTTLDQISEIVAYIKNNKSLINGITTGKVSTTDIIDNLTTNVANKPLSAAQGVVLKNLIDAIVIPTTLPNPQKLSINIGGTTVEYDGTEKVTVVLPDQIPDLDEDGILVFAEYPELNEEGILLI